VWYFSKVPSRKPLISLLFPFFINQMPYSKNGSFFAFLVQKLSGTRIEKNFQLFFQPLWPLASRDFFFWCTFPREHHFTKSEFDILISTRDSRRKSVKKAWSTSCPVALKSIPFYKTTYQIEDKAEKT
jgi:hypothetical protein